MIDKMAITTIQTINITLLKAFIYLKKLFYRSSFPKGTHPIHLYPVELLCQEHSKGDSTGAIIPHPDKNSMNNDFHIDINTFYVYDFG